MLVIAHLHVGVCDVGRVEGVIGDEGALLVPQHEHLLLQADDVDGAEAVQQGELKAKPEIGQGEREGASATNFGDSLAQSDVEFVSGKSIELRTHPLRHHVVFVDILSN